MARGIYGERCAVSISLFHGVIRRHNERSAPPRWLRMTLKLDFVTFGGGEQVDVAAGGASSLARGLDHPIDIVVGMRWLVVKQGHAARLSFDRDVGHVIGAAVPPAAPRRVLLRRVLRVLNK